jgi:hypothetical protein
MDTSTLSSGQHQLRMNVRNFLLTATLNELKRELELSNERKDTFRAACVQELIDSWNEND